MFFWRHISHWTGGYKCQFSGPTPDLQQSVGSDQPSGDSDPSSSLQTAALGPAHPGFGALVAFRVGVTLLLGERAQQTNNCLTAEEVKIEARAVQEASLQTDYVLDLGSRLFGMGAVFLGTVGWFPRQHTKACVILNPAERLLRPREESRSRCSPLVTTAE